MATFDTPEPISARIAVTTGEVLISAGKRLDTVVEVRPSNPAKTADVRAAEQAKVDYSRGKLVVKGPSLRGSSGLPPHGGSIDVTIEVPAGSTVRGSVAWGALRSQGVLGECRLEVAEGDLHLDRTGPVHLSTSSGEITVTHVEGDAKIGTGSGAIHVDEIDGTATVSNDMGEVRIGEITGSLRLTGMHADFRVDRPHDSVEVKTVHGAVRIGEVTRGSVEITAASAQIDVGICAGTAAKLDLSTVSGSVHNQLPGVDGPSHSDRIVEVRARTLDGDIVIRRAP
ncbi:DUF4097 family beta strand repeat-containing protein [Streptomyces lanatus]|uniref:DUF4097 family beta strand repeat-containing protein n=1 Tax=Streptomyces lanatus TaxID=66900 RepID=A0ABV1XXK9_9ACTN|nr:DUF4097 family beta strand repeat-containing protein [Streptomyces lanatus]GHH17916.1 hypothetical protein GCM10018780_61900 [Streptomyces lanatus]